MAQVGKLKTLASLITAGIAFIGLVFATSGDFRNWWRCNVNIDISNNIRNAVCSIDITEPQNNASIEGLLDIKGTARNIPGDWQLVVLTQSPDELKYYVTSGGAVKVDNGTWHVDGARLGSGNSEDVNKDYTIVALLLDGEGQRELQAVLAKPDEHGDFWISHLPHSVIGLARKVRLVPPSLTGTEQ